MVSETDGEKLYEIVKYINSALLETKESSIKRKIYQKMRSTGATAKFYGLAQVDKNGIPLRPVLSIPGSSYYNLNKFLTPYFDKLPGVKVKLSTLDARR